MFKAQRYVLIMNAFNVVDPVHKGHQDHGSRSSIEDNFLTFLYFIFSMRNN